MYVMGVYSDLTKLCCFETSHISTELPRNAWLCALIEVCLQTLFQRERKSKTLVGLTLNDPFNGFVVSRCYPRKQCAGTLPHLDRLLDPGRVPWPQWLWTTALWFQNDGWHGLLLISTAWRPFSVPSILSLPNYRHVSECPFSVWLVSPSLIIAVQAIFCSGAWP